MKRRNLFITASLSMLLGLGVAAGAATLTNTKQIEKVEATTTTYAGSVGIECPYIGAWGCCWDDSSAKIAAYVWNGSNNGWTSMITGNSTHYYSLSYSFSFDPFGGKMKLVRFASDHSDTPDWSNTWADSGDQDFGQVAILQNWTATIYDKAATYMHFDGYGSTDTVSNRLSYTKRNDSSHWEYYNTNLSFKQYDYGKVNFHGSDYCNGIHDVDSSYVYIDYDHIENNIVCKYYGTGYSVYFDTTNKNSYFGIPNRAIAEKWGDTFLNTITCTGTSPGAVTSTKTAWTQTMKGKYDALTTDQQGIIWTLPANDGGTFLEQAVYRYDFILHKYGKSNYSDFIGRMNSGGGYAMGLATNPLLMSLQGNNISGLLTIVIVSSVTLLSIGGYFFLRKKKEK